MSNFAHVSTIFVVLLFLLCPEVSLASDRTYCFSGFRFDDDRDLNTVSDCAKDGTAGARRGCKAGNNYMVGAWFDVYDYDPDGSDEFIKRYRVSSPGLQCYSFPWEGESYQNGEADPDIYVKFINVVQSTTGGNTLEVRDENGDVFSATSWRTASRIDNCTGVCTSPHILIVSNNSAAYTGARMSILDSGQHTLEVYSDIMTHDVKYWVEPCSSNCPNTVSTSMTKVKGAQDDGITGRTAAHELGHALHKQLFDRDDLFSNCANSPTAPDLNEYESCATTEGWAQYVAAVSWWDPDNDLSQPFLLGRDIEWACQLNDPCSTGDNGSYIYQVTKSFWDMDDANNEAGDCGSTLSDSYNATSLSIALGWEEFPDGTGNRHDHELDWDGPNVWDYYYNNDSIFANPNLLKNTLMYHNCIGTQDQN